MDFFNIKNIENSRKVLVIPNITNSQNIEKDSFVDVIYNHIIGLEKLGDYYWNIVLPKPVKKLNLDNVKQHIIEFSGDMINMRVTFPTKLIRLLQTLDYDVIYSHLPDWYMVARYTDKKIIGYSHWWELKTCNSEDFKNRLRNIPAEILGVLTMDTCFLNTQDQKNRVIDEAREWFSDDKIKLLDTKLQVWNLGVHRDKIVTKLSDLKEKIIVFNHRAAAYKGYPQFIEYMKEYRNKRQDFKVWVPQLNEPPEYSWIDNTKVDKSEYYTKLQSCTVGIQMRQTNYGWSVAATDCMMNGTPVIFQESDCYHEIDPQGMFFKYKKDLFHMLDSLLDDADIRKKKENQAIQRAIEISDNEEKMLNIIHTKFNN